MTLKYGKILYGSDTEFEEYMKAFYHGNGGEYEESGT